jgi:hypothetical protein
MKGMFNLDRSAERGQILVIVAAGMLVFIAMVALVIDGGHAWAQQRDTQNGNDAAAEAGAVLLAENLPYRAAGETVPHQDEDVLNAVEGMAATNNIDVEEAQYTDFDGVEIGVEVGSLGSVPPPDDALGVKVNASKDFNTLLAGTMGFNQLTAETDATAHAGYVITQPSGVVLPVTIPVTVPQCDGTNNLVTTTDPWIPGDEYTLYLCSAGPGNVGWLEWFPPGGGCSTLADSIETPDNPPLDIPGWYFVTQTGNCNSTQVQAALETWIDRPVTIPLFDATCDSQPPTATDVCGTGPGTGTNQYYHFKNWIEMTIREVHVTGTNAACNALNGSTSCIIVTFHSMMGPGTLGAPVGDEHVLAEVGVGLIE